MAVFTKSGFADEIAPDLDSQIKGLQANKISFVEMRNVNGKSLIDHTVEEVKEIKNQLDASGIKLSAIGSYLGKQSIEEEFTHLDKLKSTLELADILGVGSIRMFSFFIPEGKNADDYRGIVMERWHAFVEAAKGSGIMLLHENEKGIYGDNAERCLDIVTQMNDTNMKLIFDPANFVQCGVTPYPNAWNTLKDYVYYFHIKDALAATGEVTPAGYGDGNVLSILKDANASNPDKSFFLSLEPHLANFQGFASLENGNESLPEGDNVNKFSIASDSLDKLLTQL